jgi:hypothetical protein
MSKGAITLIAVAMMLQGCGASSSTAGSAADLDKIESLIGSGNYEFTIRSASPSGGRTIQITSYYSMKAVEGRYEANLPYFGRAYSAGYGENGGIEFNDRPQDLQITRNEKKKRVSVKFSVNSDNDLYKVSLDIGSSGYGNMTVYSEKRQSISYYGIAGELKN